MIQMEDAIGGMLMLFLILLFAGTMQHVAENDSPRRVKRALYKTFTGTLKGMFIGSVVLAGVLGIDCLMNNGSTQYLAKIMILLFTGALAEMTDLTMKGKNYLFNLPKEALINLLLAQSVHGECVVEYQNKGYGFQLGGTGNERWEWNELKLTKLKEDELYKIYIQLLEKKEENTNDMHGNTDNGI